MGHSSSLATLASVLALSSTAFSQVLVSPAINKTVEGPTYGSAAFGNNSSSGWRFQQVHDDLRGARATLRELALRRDASIATRYPTYEFNLDLILSTAATTSTTMQAGFDANHGSNRIAVISNKKIVMPATFSDGVAAPFVYRMKFDAPYAFDGGNNGLCWEARVSLMRGLTYTAYFDVAYWQNTSPALAQAYYGSGCTDSTQQTAAQLQASSSASWTQKTGSISLSGYYFARSSVAIAALGFSRSSYGALPLPFVLPGSATAYSGPCSVLASLDVVYATATDSNGYAALQIPIPVEQSFAGAKLFLQWLSEDKATSALIPLITSNAVEMQFVPPYGQTEIAYNVASSPLLSTGTVTGYTGYVVALY